LSKFFLAKTYSYHLKLHSLYSCFKPLIIIWASVLTVIPVHVFSQTNNIKFYQSSIATYPKVVDLFSGLLINKTKIPQPFYIYYSIKKNNQLLDSGTVTGLNLPIGSFNVVDSNFKYHFNTQSTITDSANIPSGDIEFEMKIYINSEIIASKRLLNVPLYQCKINTLNDDSISIHTEPHLPNIQVYLTESVLSKNKRRIKASRSYFNSHHVISKPNSVSDTVGGLVYQIAVYHNDILLYQSAVKPWSELTSTSEPLKIENIKKIKNKGYPALKLNSSIDMEYGYSNTKYVNQIADNHYLRIYIKPTITILGIPLTLNSMISTERTNLYPLNKIQFGFDANQFKRDFSNNAVKDLLDTKNRIDLNQSELASINKT
jgi:hypothetical protein